MKQDMEHQQPSHHHGTELYHSDDDDCRHPPKDGRVGPTGFHMQQSNQHMSASLDPEHRHGSAQAQAQSQSQSQSHTLSKLSTSSAASSPASSPSSTETTTSSNTRNCVGASGSCWSFLLAPLIALIWSMVPADGTRPGASRHYEWTRVYQIMSWLETRRISKHWYDVVSVNPLVWKHTMFTITKALGTQPYDMKLDTDPITVRLNLQAARCSRLLNISHITRDHLACLQVTYPFEEVWDKTSLEDWNEQEINIITKRLAYGIRQFALHQVTLQTGTGTSQTKQHQQQEQQHKHPHEHDMKHSFICTSPPSLSLEHDPLLMFWHTPCWTQLEKLTWHVELCPQLIQQHQQLDATFTDNHHDQVLFPQLTHANIAPMGLTRHILPLLSSHHMPNLQHVVFQIRSSHDQSIASSSRLSRRNFSHAVSAPASAGSVVLSQHVPTPLSFDMIPEMTLRIQRHQCNWYVSPSRWIQTLVSSNIHIPILTIQITYKEGILQPQEDERVYGLLVTLLSHGGITRSCSILTIDQSQGNERGLSDDSSSFNTNMPPVSFASFHQLTKLRLICAYITDREMDMLHIDQCTTLHELYIERARKLTGSFFVSWTRPLSTLHTLSLADGAYSDAAVCSLLSLCPSVTVLYIQNCRDITDQVMNMIITKSLTRLILRATWLSCAGINVLCTPSVSNVCRLSLACLDIRDNGNVDSHEISHMIHRTSLPSLAALAMCGNELQYTFSWALQTCTNIEKLLGVVGLYLADYPATRTAAWPAELRSWNEQQLAKYART